MEGRWTLSDSLLTIEIHHRIGAISLDVSFALTQPWTVLFGPSGGGKTTVLRTIAGFVHPRKGRIVCGNAVLTDSSAKIFVPAYQRPIRSAGQVAKLFPQMTVRSNTVYGNGWASRPADAMDIAEQVMTLFRIRELADRMPSDLSGGERQRASVARAVVSATTFGGPGTALLLLDEPSSGLDSAVRDQLLTELQAWLIKWKIPVLSVTHDVGEAFQLGAEVIALSDGKVVRQGPVGEVLADERLRLMERLNVMKKSPA
jgi:molybdate transport system ATP-binding protein